MGKKAQRNPQTQGELEAQRQGYINGMTVAADIYQKFPYDLARSRLLTAIKGEQAALNSMVETLKEPEVSKTKYPKLGTVRVTDKNVAWAAIKTNRTETEIRRRLAHADGSGIVCTVPILEKKSVRTKKD